MGKKVFLVDLDNTLLDTESLREIINNRFIQKFGKRVNLQSFVKIQDEVVENFMILDIKEVAKKVSKLVNIKSTKEIERIYTEAPFKKCLFPEAIKLLKLLKKQGSVYIYSGGDKLFQSSKTDKCGITRIVGKENIIIVRNKQKDIGERIYSFKRQNFEEIIFIDDRIDYLKKAYELSSDVSTLLIKFGKYSLQSKSEETNFLTFEGNSLKEIFEFLKTYVGRISNYKIEKKINEKQITQLIKYANTDQDVKKFTSDPKRFKNRKVFDEWFKKGRTIYTLSDSSNKLLGILWFSKEKFDSFKKNPHYSAVNYPYTLGLRLYLEARGKGLSKKFMNLVFEDFNKKGFWLTTSNDNLAAIKLYNNFGFKQIPDENPYNKIVMLYK